MLGKDDRAGCVMAVEIRSEYSGWAISDPAWSKIMTVPCSPGRWAWTNSLNVSSFEVGSKHARHLAAQWRADGDDRRA